MAIFVGDGFRITSALPADLKAIWATTHSLYEAVPVSENGYISASWRYEGMSAWCVDAQEEYRLVGGTGDGDWQLTASSGSLSSSYALTASVGLTSITASFALNSAGSGTTLFTGSLYEITASHSLTSSFTPYAKDTKSVLNSTTSSLLSVPFNSYNSIFVNYMINDGSNFRAGNVVVIYTTESLRLTEVCTTDIGNSDGFTVDAEISGTWVNLYAINDTSEDYTFNYHYDVI